MDLESYHGSDGSTELVTEWSIGHLVMLVTRPGVGMNLGVYVM